MRCLGAALVVGCLGVWTPESVALASAKCPNLTILLDASGSMLENPAGPSGAIDPVVANRKYTVAAKALTDLVNLYDGVLPIGMSIFPSDGMCGAATLNIAPALYTRQSIISLLGSSAPASFAPDTPTSASIASLVAKPPLKDATRRQYVLLLTDGEPYCSNGSESVAQSVTAVKNAYNGTPQVKTFVVGFGQLNATAQSTMNQLADAGGVPSGDSTYHYYRADSSAALVSALDKVLTTISGDAGGMQCDDSCYGMGCATATDKCVAGMCKPDPCAGVACTAPQFCYTDGTSAGVCVDSCASPCGAGTHCERGQCVSDPCGAPCGPGKRCNQATSQCEADPACTSLVPKCLSPRGCISGQCVDDPCASGLIACPDGTACTPWAGTCQSLTAAPTDTGSVASGCGCRIPGRGGSEAPTAAVAALLLGAVLFRRRTWRQAQGRR